MNTTNLISDAEFIRDTANNCNIDFAGLKSKMLSDWTSDNATELSTCLDEMNKSMESIKASTKTFCQNLTAYVNAIESADASSKKEL